MDYNFGSLGPTEFEALCKAILGNVLGPEVEVKNYDPTPPRPWEAEFEGSFTFPGQSRDTGWNGFGVLIVKYTSKQLTPTRAASWFRQAMRHELEALSPDGSYRGRRAPDR